MHTTMSRNQSVEVLLSLLLCTPMLLLGLIPHLLVACLPFFFTAPNTHPGNENPSDHVHGLIAC